MNLFSNHFKNLRSVIRNRHSVTRNGHSEVRNAYSVSRNGDFSKAKLLQKSEMRKDIVIELSYKGFG